MGGLLWGAFHRTSGPKWVWGTVIAGTTFRDDSCVMFIHVIRYGLPFLPMLLHMGYCTVSHSTLKLR